MFCNTLHIDVVYEMLEFEFFSGIITLDRIQHNNNKSEILTNAVSLNKAFFYQEISFDGLQLLVVNTVSVLHVLSVPH